MVHETARTQRRSPALIVDFDDFCEDNHGIEYLDHLRENVRTFCATLFTIPGRCSAGWLQAIRDERPWLDFVPHGWAHLTARECENWTAADTERYIDRIEPFQLRNGFKAPGWQISDATFNVMNQRGYWVADQAYNRQRRPAGLLTYEIDRPGRIHGHIGHLGGHNANAIEYLIPAILQAAEDGSIETPNLKTPPPFYFAWQNLERTNPKRSM